MLAHSLSHDPLQVRRIVKLEFSALLTDGTSRVNSEVSTISVTIVS